ncbi:dynamin family protein [Arcanobacterium ihumii]|uniref:dynamin family protein n=1 Tax=Arcanobacterium ihumii TaxID=2138162 RepID=UPI000F53A5CF|nr:dynamin family protein [Arcanobacterium ihumii]
MLDASVPDSAENPVPSVLHDLRSTLNLVRFPFAIVGSDDAQEAWRDVNHQLDDYILPRFSSLDAPLLAVVGGSTGSGKSTLINSLLKENLTKASALRPTTRIPTLICHPDEAHWFEYARILPDLARRTGSDAEMADDAGAGTDVSQRVLANGSEISVNADGERAIMEIAVKTSTLVPRGIALLDSPDIDSVERANRVLAAQLMAAADLWIFVTTAHRYADAIPWVMLDDAARRNLVIAVLLNRVPIGVGVEVRADLDRKLSERGLSHAPLFTIAESDLGEHGQLPELDIVAIRDWIAGIARDTAGRSLVARQTLMGAVTQLADRVEEVHQGYEEQLLLSRKLTDTLDGNIEEARRAMVEELGSGVLLRGEVLRTWQDLVGAGQITRKLETQISMIRDRITSFFTTKKPSVSNVEAAVEEVTYTMVVAHSQQAVLRTFETWSKHEGTDTLVETVRSRVRSEDERKKTAERLVRDWQVQLLAMIRERGESKRAMARIVSLGINAVGVALMIVVFASTGGLVGGEIAVAGGTAVVAQRVLEAIFGDDAVRKMTADARDDFDRRVSEFLATDKNVFIDELAKRSVSEQVLDKLKENMEDLHGAITTRKIRS